jgi:DNA-binding PadR family transcriptional regulator
MSPSTSTPRDLLTPATLHVLISLAEGDRHGYGIKLDVEERTRGELSLGPGTLYEAIHRMEGLGFIEVSPRPKSKRTEGSGRGRPRKYYRLTREGRRQLEDELVRLRDLVQYARAHRLLPDTSS